jgi:hypothetical protein
MASLPARIIDQLLLRPLEALLSHPGPLKLRLDTGRRLTRVEMITDPAYLKMVWYVQPGDPEAVFTDLPECTVLGFDYYDQDGVRFLRSRNAKAVSPGDSVAVPLIVNAW